MVVLTKIEPSFFKSLGFKNRTSGITFIKYVLQVIPNKYKTENDLKKYLQPKISNLESLGIISMIKQIVKYIKLSKN